MQKGRFFIKIIRITKYAEFALLQYKINGAFICWLVVWLTASVAVICTTSWIGAYYNKELVNAVTIHQIVCEK